MTHCTGNKVQLLCELSTSMREPENVDPTQIRNLWKVLKFDLLETQNSGFWPKKESKGFSTLLLLPHSFSTRPTSSFHSFHLSIHSSTSNIHFLPTIPLISHNTILAQTPSSLNSPIWRSKYPLRSSSKVPFMDFKLLVITFFNYFGMLLHFIVSNFEYIVLWKWFHPWLISPKHLCD